MVSENVVVEVETSGGTKIHTRTKLCIEKSQNLSFSYHIWDAQIRPKEHKCHKEGSSHVNAWNMVDQRRIAPIAECECRVEYKADIVRGAVSKEYFMEKTTHSFVI